MKYGILVTDCCDCEAVQCLDCDPPESEESLCPSGSGARPKDCYSYTKYATYARPPSECFRSNCIENVADSPVDEVRNRGYRSSDSDFAIRNQITDIAETY